MDKETLENDKFILSAVPADGLAPSGAWTYIDTALVKQTWQIWVNT